jgi:N-acylneuraminate cytidylyltransferase
MIARTIQTVIQSEVATRIVVSTDDREIAEVAIAAGAEVPFTRPAELADDHTPTAPVIAHAITCLRERDQEYDLTLVVYPTAVLVRVQDLRGAIDAFRRSSADLVMSVGRYPAAIERAWRRHSDGRGSMIQPKHELTRTQDLEEAFFDAGQFYLGTVAFWLDGGRIASCNPLLYPLPRLVACDIDTEEDFRTVERLLVSLNSPDR